ncbi:protein unc-79 homolog isoform X1 [Hydra vulgaris]|uniref:protein unc-79 homolog isoform X1 n=1 Tax=Hydra vulgaris TaxID=6087 RepID=UPI001F5EA69F|nr:protein unc-79 homolog [Hydra vulgaris]
MKMSENVDFTSTKSKQFNAKVHQLQEMLHRVTADKSGNTGKELLIQLKYFHNTLSSWVKDSYPCFNLDNHEFNHDRFPNAKYEPLYNTLLEFISQTQSIDDEELESSLLKAVAYVLPFLPTEVLLSTPMSLVTCLFDVTPWMQGQIIDMLTQYVLPLMFCFITKDVSDELAEINLIIPSLIAIVLDATSSTGIWTKIMECLMKYKSDVVTDLLMNLAYGSNKSLEASIHLLNRYFAPVNIGSMKTNQSSNYDQVVLHTCQSSVCKDAVKFTNADKVILDPDICAAESKEPPPFFLCLKCFGAIEYKSVLCLDVIQPATQVSQVCDNNDCRFGFMKALYFCFSLDCAIKNEHKPMRLCVDCDERLHSKLKVPHANHCCLQEVWSIPNPKRSYVIDTIIRLCNQAQPDFSEKYSQLELEVDVQLVKNRLADSYDYMAKMAQSIHGIYLLNAICTIPPSSTFEVEDLGKLLATAIVWIETVEYTSNFQIKNLIKQYRQQTLSWIMQLMKFNSELYISCLLPDPPLYARVGHPWNMLASVVRKDLELMQRLSKLIVHELIPENIWERVFPIWLKEIKERIPQSDICKFKKILGQIFGVNSNTHSSYALSFLYKRLQSTEMQEYLEALVWVQILSYLDVHIDMLPLFDIFIKMIIGVEKNISSTVTAFPFPDKVVLERMNSNKLVRSNSLTPGSPPQSATPVTSGMPMLLNVKDHLTFAVLMLDVLIKQLTIQKSDSDIQISKEECNSIVILLVCILDQLFNVDHSEHINGDCMQCQVMTIILYQTALLLDLVIVDQIKCQVLSHEYSRSMKKSFSKKEKLSKDFRNSEDILSQPIPEEDSNEEHLINDDADKDILKVYKGNNLDKLMFSFPELRIMESLLQQLKHVCDTSGIVHIISCLEVLCYRGKCLQAFAKMEEKLIQSFQKKLLIPSLWKLLESSSSNIAKLIAPLLLHCSLLPYGTEIICERIEIDINAESWKTRFDVVDKIGLICQFFGGDFSHNEHPGKSVVVHGITYLAYALQDVNVSVAMKARSMMQAIKSTSLKSMYTYMEEHYTSISGDQLFILQSYQSIHSIIPQLSPISTSFFLQMFKKTKKIDRKNKQKLVLQDRILSSSGEEVFVDSILPMYSRKLVQVVSKSSEKVSLKKVISLVGDMPLMAYRNRYTLQCNKRWRTNEKNVADLKMKKRSLIPGDFQSTLECTLDTVNEEKELKEERKPHNSHNILLEDLVNHEDEVFTILIEMLVSFLSSKINDKVESDKSLGSTIIEEIKDIIHFLGILLGLEEVSGNWHASNKLNLRLLRKSATFSTLLINLPQLLDRSITYGSHFIQLVLTLLRLCVRRTLTDDVFIDKITILRLEPHLQHSWLTILIIILYKHSFHEYKKEIWELVNIVRNTLDAHNPHYCQNVSLSKPFSLATMASAKILAKKVNRTTRQNPTYNEEFDEHNCTDNANASDSKLNEKFGVTGAPIQSSEAVFGCHTNEEEMLEYTVKHCAVCKLELFTFDEESITLCMVSLLTFIHMDPSLAAPFIIDVIQSVTRKAQIPSLTPDSKRNPTMTSTSSVAIQFLRCVFYKLSSNRLFLELFRVDSENDELFLKMAGLLQDSSSLTQLDPLKLALQDLLDSRSADLIMVFLHNIFVYTRCVINTHTNQWSSMQSVFKDFLKFLPTVMPLAKNMDCVLDTMSLLLSSQKALGVVLIDHIDDIMTHIIKNCTFGATSLQLLCTACVECFAKDKNSVKFSREQLKLTRKLCLLLSSVLTNKSSMPESSLTKLIQFFSQELGTKFDFPRQVHILPKQVLKTSNAMECLELNHYHDLLEYMKAPLQKLKDSDSDKLTVDSFESYITLAISQLLACYANKNSKSKISIKIMSIFDSCTNDRFNGQAVYFDYHENFMHVRFLAWMYLATINHYNRVNKEQLEFIPKKHSLRIATLIDLLLRTALENENKSFKNFTCLHFSFLLAQIWTVYMEITADPEALSYIREFWAKLTSTVYTLLQTTSETQLKTMHLFSSMVENFSVLCPRTFSQIFPLWMPLMQLYINEIPSKFLERINSQKKAVESINKRDELLMPWIIDMHRQLWKNEKTRQFPNNLLNNSLA